MTECERSRTHRNDGTSGRDQLELINIVGHWFESNRGSKIPMSVGAGQARSLR
jgi:hypothetical protein